MDAPNRSERRCRYSNLAASSVTEIFPTTIDEVDLSLHNKPGLTLGSIEGDGFIFLGSNNLTVGANNADSTFSGQIKDDRISQGSVGSLTKIGKGTLILTGSNVFNGGLYVGGTVVEDGTLLTSGQGGVTGVGGVRVNAGTLGGKDLLFGPVIMGSGSGPGFPFAGSKLHRELSGDRYPSL